MRQLTRLLRYALPYWGHILASVLLMAAVGVLDAFKYLLVGPVFDRVLNPSTGSKDIQLFALVASTVLKGICDYSGTYLVNHAGFGTITDLRDDLYNAILRRSAAFFSKHTTGTLLSTIINDVERIQYAMSTVLAEFLQQFFTFLSVAAVVGGPR